MLESFWFCVVIGTALGFLSGLGTGGGSLLILWLTMVLSMEPANARAINLLFFLPSAVVACLFRWKQGKLDFGKILPAIVWGCGAAALFSWVGTVLDTGLLEKMFGVLLLITGLRELFYRPRKTK